MRLPGTLKLQIIELIRFLVIFSYSDRGMFLLMYNESDYVFKIIE
jgi:hypothetical protein